MDEGYKEYDPANPGLLLPRKREVDTSKNLGSGDHDIRDNLPLANSNTLLNPPGGPSIITAITHRNCGVRCSIIPLRLLNPAEAVKLPITAIRGFLVDARPKSEQEGSHSSQLQNIHFELDPAGIYTSLTVSDINSIGVRELESERMVEDQVVDIGYNDCSPTTDSLMNLSGPEDYRSVCSASAIDGQQILSDLLVEKGINPAQLRVKDFLKLCLPPEFFGAGTGASEFTTALIGPRQTYREDIPSLSQYTFKPVLVDHGVTLDQSTNSREVSVSPNQSFVTGSSVEVTVPFVRLRGDNGDEPKVVLLNSPFSVAKIVTAIRQELYPHVSPDSLRLALLFYQDDNTQQSVHHLHTNPEDHAHWTHIRWSDIDLQLQRLERGYIVALQKHTKIEVRQGTNMQLTRQWHIATWTDDHGLRQVGRELHRILYELFPTRHAADAPGDRVFWFQLDRFRTNWLRYEDCSKASASIAIKNLKDLLWRIDDPVVNVYPDAKVEDGPLQQAQAESALRFYEIADRTQQRVGRDLALEAAASDFREYEIEQYLSIFGSVDNVASAQQVFELRKLTASKDESIHRLKQELRRSKADQEKAKDSEEDRRRWSQEERPGLWLEIQNLEKKLQQASALGQQARGNLATDDEAEDNRQINACVEKTGRERDRAGYQLQQAVYKYEPQPADQDTTICKGGMCGDDVEERHDKDSPQRAKAQQALSSTFPRQLNGESHEHEYDQLVKKFRESEEQLGLARSELTMLRDELAQVRQELSEMFVRAKQMQRRKCSIQKNFKGEGQQRRFPKSKIEHVCLVRRPRSPPLRHRAGKPLPRCRFCLATINHHNPLDTHSARCPNGMKLTGEDIIFLSPVEWNYRKEQRLRQGFALAIAEHTADHEGIDQEPWSRTTCSSQGCAASTIPPTAPPQSNADSVICSQGQMDGLDGLNSSVAKDTKISNTKDRKAGGKQAAKKQGGSDKQKVARATHGDEAYKEVESSAGETDLSIENQVKVDPVKAKKRKRAKHEVFKQEADVDDDEDDELVTPKKPTKRRKGKRK